jgi:DNA modification methylase
LLKSLPSGSVDAVVTDPPYGMKWDTDSTRFCGGNRSIDTGDGRDDWPEIHGDGAPFDPTPWLGFPKVVMFGSNHYAARLPIGTTLVWIKRADHLFQSFLSDAELAWMKGGHGVYCFRKQFPPPSRMAENNGAVAHPTQKPIELMKWCLDMAKIPVGATVLDPYMGSGTTGVACIQTGRKFIGFELDRKYCELAARRIADVGPLFRAAVGGVA